MADGMTIKLLEREYELVPPFTNRELHIVKQVSGVRAGEVWDAMEAGDNDVLVALAHIAVRRTGAPRPSLDELWDLPAGGIEIVEPDEAEDPTTPPDGGESDPAGSPETTPPPAGDGNTEPTST